MEAMRLSVMTETWPRLTAHARCCNIAGVDTQCGSYRGDRRDPGRERLVTLFLAKVAPRLVAFMFLLSAKRRYVRKSRY